MQALSQLSYTPAAKEGRIIGSVLQLVKGFLRFLEIAPKKADNFVAPDQHNDCINRRRLSLTC